MGASKTWEAKLIVTLSEHHSNISLFGFGTEITDHVKKLFKPSDIQISNFVFTLHQQWTFVIVFIGLIFSMGNNYLNKDAITCHGGSDYINNFCFLHGSSHIPQVLQAELSSSTSCISEDESGGDQDKVRTTHYYIWLPFILAIIATLTKLPGILWKILERGMMKKLVLDMDESGSKTALRFQKVVLKGKTSSVQAMIYNFGFAFCEVLNLVVILVSHSMLNSLFNNEYASYGTNVQAFRSFIPNPSLPELTNARPVNPMCHLFPTEVSCSVKTGGIGGNTNKENILCLLPNNVFYQYYFLILWWWWVVLIFITCLALVYRLVQIVLPQVGRMRLEAIRAALGVDKKCRVEMKLQAWDVFLLTRLVGNLKGSQVTKLLEVLDNEEEDNEEEDNEEEEIASLLDHEEGNETSQEMEMV